MKCPEPCNRNCNGGLQVRMRPSFQDSNTACATWPLSVHPASCLPLLSGRPSSFSIVLILTEAIAVEEAFKLHVLPFTRRPTQPACVLLDATRMEGKVKAFAVILHQSCAQSPLHLQGWIARHSRWTDKGWSIWQALVRRRKLPGEKRLL